MLKKVLLTPIAGFILLLALGLYILDRLVWKLTGWSFIGWLYDRVDHKVDKVQRDFSAGPLR